MLNIFSSNTGKYCDGLNRRNFLRIGALGLGNISLLNLLHAQGKTNRHKAVIMIYLPGGPSHQDIFDLKTDAPKEIRGEFKPISTNVPGIQICEHLPKLAKIADKFSIIRSVVGSVDRHDSVMCFSGRPEQNSPAGGHPCLGSTLSKIQGAVNTSIPPFIGLAPKMGHIEWADSGKSGFLGATHSPFETNKGGGQDDMVLNGVTLERLSDRASLLKSVDNLIRSADYTAQFKASDAYQQQAMGILTSSQLIDALNIEKEPKYILDMYGKGDPKNRDDGAPKLTEHFLTARRLVEAGARCVTLAFSRWDHHGDNFGALKQDLPLLDRALTALITDLHQRGLSNDVSVIVWGEFGRTPTINKDAGRDHWSRVSCALLAGGGMKHGQVIGSTDRLGGEADSRPVSFGEIFATLYHSLGVNINTATVPDLAGRPHFLVDGQLPMKELVG